MINWEALSIGLFLVFLTGGTLGGVGVRMWVMRRTDSDPTPRGVWILLGFAGAAFIGTLLYFAAQMVLQPSLDAPMMLVVGGLIARWIWRGCDTDDGATSSLEVPHTPLEQAFGFVPSDLGANRIGEWGERQRLLSEQAYQRGFGLSVMLVCFMLAGLMLGVVWLLAGEWRGLVPLGVFGLQLTAFAPMVGRFWRGHHLEQAATIIKLAGVRKAYFEYAPVVEDDVEYDRYALTHEGVRVEVWPDEWAALEDEAVYIFYCMLDADNEATVLSVEVGAG